MSIRRPKRWSYSALSTYEECPAKYAYSYIKNLPWPSSPAMERGTRLHQMAEDYMRETGPVPYDLKKIGKTLDELRQQSAIPEQVWLVDRDWRPVEDPRSAWVKAIVDVHHIDGSVLHLADYKSGREYPSHRSQLELYSILGLLKYDMAQRAESRAIYIDGGFSGSEGSIIREMLPKLIEKWTIKAERMENDNDFIAAPGSSCRWCPYRSSVGGPCGESAKAGV